MINYSFEGEGPCRHPSYKKKQNSIDYVKLQSRKIGVADLSVIDGHQEIIGKYAIEKSAKENDTTDSSFGIIIEKMKTLLESPKRIERSCSYDEDKLQRNIDLFRSTSMHDAVSKKTPQIYHKRSCFYPKPDIEKLRKISMAHKSDLDQLKTIALKLELDPKYVKRESPSLHISFCKSSEDSENSTKIKMNYSNNHKNEITRKSNSNNSERMNNVEHVLDQLKSEIMNMQLHDYALAKQFVRLRKEIHKFRLQKCYLENETLLEQAIDDNHEDELKIEQISDHPPHLFCPELKQIGLTPMNLSLRRFSVF